MGVAVATVWTSADAPREQDAAAVAAVPDVERWTSGLSAEDRRGLHGRTVTQGLLGEPVEVVDEVAGWSEVRLPWQPCGPTDAGYPGWIPTAHLAPASSADGESVAVVRPVTWCALEPGEPLRMSYGTVLPIRGTDGECTVVTLPGGRPALTLTTNLRRLGDRPTGEELVVSARQFVGLRYLWGGTCGWGLDCSGLVHLAHRVHGLRVPRDASDQHEQAPVRLAGAASVPGGLFFFARPGQRAYHVGFMAPGDRRAMLHAPESGTGGAGTVEEAPMSPDRTSTLVGAATYLPDP